MRSVAIVVIGELSQHRTEVRLIDHDQVVEGLSPNGPHDPLGDGVGGRRPWPGANSGDAQVRQLAVEREVPARANDGNESIETEPKQFEHPSG